MTDPRIDRDAAIKWAITLESHARMVWNNIDDQESDDGIHLRDLMEAIDQTVADLRTALGAERGFAPAENEGQTCPLGEPPDECCGSPIGCIIVADERATNEKEPKS